ncbi:MAG: hypothetical protein LUH21_21580 [Clostridiales bacterium]|nr:hypothetical protein [Clostridiales bacterium]
MVSKKGKRQIEYNGNTFFWFVRKNNLGEARIHILSEDKKINLEYPLLDKEVPSTKKELKGSWNCTFLVRNKEFKTLK